MAIDTSTSASAAPVAYGDLLERMRHASPLVQCITNYVAMNYAANILLAAGASPAMVHAPEEAGEFARLADAVTINIGTLSTHWLEGMRAAARTANETRKPWVLDPVAHFATGFRRKAVEDLLGLRPTIIRGNASEIMALAGLVSAGRGVDAGDSVEEAETAALALSRSTHAVVAVTGASDFVTDGSQAVRIGGGSALMPRVTAMGCALTCLVGAFAAAVPETPFLATVTALACFSAAGSRAEQESSGPGSFAWRFTDALAALDARALQAQTDKVIA
ncbi:hydroxyethylthiazole kinase [Dyella caseinilytica]|uniref:Hydroxyethylthiazole kinase n=1 Tax=Dyella caseinilytica TaxID=1849581 RepID=A0ABX7H0T2_9GAMM|nr:hydroxyethylthiazole kinase [Dyella caseinilytica]QRN55497.1 hydroxyethylthiazole kinase [Dyella caseinilytica]GGA02195.1 hydroxyethylthiazole kinase [Dyella caseinilytica]